MFSVWIDLPNDIKIMIVELLEVETRNSLKQCSFWHKLLIDSYSFPSKSLTHCVVDITEDGNPKFITSFNDEVINEYSEDTSRNFEFENLAFLSKYLMTELAKFDYIRKLSFWRRVSPRKQKIIEETTPETQYFQLISSSSINLLKVECIEIKNFSSSETQFILQQLEPRLLKKAYIDLDKCSESTELYDLPQILSTNDLTVYSNSVTDQQLLKIPAKKLELGISKYITCDGVNKFIKYALPRLKDENMSLYFDFIENESFLEILSQGLDVISCEYQPTTWWKIVVKSPFPNVELHIYGISVCASITIFRKLR